MKSLSLLLVSMNIFLSIGQVNSFELYNKYDSIFKNECLDIFEEKRLVTLYDSLNLVRYEAKLDAIDTTSSLSDLVKESSRLNLKFLFEDSFLSLKFIAKSNNRSIEEQKLFYAQEECISQFDDAIEPAYSFSYDPNEKTDFIDVTSEEVKFIPACEPFWIDLVFGKNKKKSLQFKAEWNEELVSDVTINAPDGFQICAFSYSEKGSRGLTNVEEGNSYVFDDPQDQNRVVKIILDVNSTGSMKPIDMWSSNAKISNVRIKIMPYYYDVSQRIKNNCYSIDHKRRIKGTRKYHEIQMKYDPINAAGTEIILKD